MADPRTNPLADWILMCLAVPVLILLCIVLVFDRFSNPEEDEDIWGESKCR